MNFQSRPPSQGQLVPLGSRSIFSRFSNSRGGGSSARSRGSSFRSRDNSDCGSGSGSDYITEDEDDDVNDNNNNVGIDESHYSVTHRMVQRIPSSSSRSQSQSQSRSKSPISHYEIPSQHNQSASRSRSRSRSRSKSPSSSKNNLYNNNNNHNNNDTRRRVHPFQIPSHQRLSPRSDTWIFLFLSSCAATASLSLGTLPVSYRGSVERISLATCGLSTVLAFGVGIAFRYRPGRKWLTGDDRGMMTMATTGRRRTRRNPTPEFYLSIVQLLLWIASSALLLSPNNYLATARTSIWNTNLFFAAYVSFGLTSCLFAELVLFQLLLPSSSSSSSQSSVVGGAGGVVSWKYRMNVNGKIIKSWILLGIASCALLAFSLDLTMSVLCDASSPMISLSSSSVLVMRSETPFCRHAILGIVFPTLGVLMSLAYIGLVLLEKAQLQRIEHDQRYNFHRNGNTKQYDQINSIANIKFQKRRHALGSILSVTNLVGYSVNAGFATSNGGPGSEPNNIYFTSWICFGISFYLCVRHLEAHLVPSSNEAMEEEEEEDGEEYYYYDDYNSHHAGVMKMNLAERANSRESVRTASTFSNNGEDADKMMLEEDVNAEDLLSQVAGSHESSSPMLYLPTTGFSGEASSMGHTYNSTWLDPQQHQHQQQHPSLTPKAIRPEPPDPSRSYYGDPTKPDPTRSDGENPSSPPSVQTKTWGDAPSIDYRRQASASSSGSEGKQQRRNSDVDGYRIKNKESFHFTEIVDDHAMEELDVEHPRLTMNSGQTRRVKNGVRSTSSGSGDPSSSMDPPPSIATKSRSSRSGTVSPGNGGNAAGSRGGKHSTTKSSKTHSRSGSKTHSRSRSNTRSPSHAQHQPQQQQIGMTSSESNNYSDNGRGPPTVSASGGSYGEGQMRGGRGGQQQWQEEEFHSSPGTVDGRPVRSIRSISDNMSTLSEPTIEGFENPQIDPAIRVATSRSGSKNTGGGSSLRTWQQSSGKNSKNNNNDMSVASSQTDENTDRRGAVDKMVMEALKQAHEARASSQPNSRSGSNDNRLQRQMSKHPGQKKSSSSRGGAASQKSKRSGSGDRSIHSFYDEHSGLSPTSNEEGGAFAC